MSNSEKSDKEENLDKDYGSAFSLDEESKIGFSDALKEFKKLDYKYLIPVGKIFDSKLFRKKAVQWVLFFGLLPLIFSWFADKFGLNFEEVVWLVEIYFCLFWALYFHTLIGPSKNVWKRGIGYALFTAAIGIPILLSIQTLPVIRNLYADTNSNNFIENLIGFLLGVGILEETTKALPLIIFSLRKKTVMTAREGIFLGFLSGLGFAASEGVTYTIRATVNAIQYGAASGQVMTFLDRVMTAPLQHSTWAGVTGWFIAAASKREKKWPVVVVGILCMALLHGLYDTFSDTIVGIIVAGVGFVVFMGYLSQKDE